MTYTTLNEFLGDWAYESESTLKVIGNITDSAMEQKVTPTGR